MQAVRSRFPVVITVMVTLVALVVLLLNAGNAASAPGTSHSGGGVISDMGFDTAYENGVLQVCIIFGEHWDATVAGVQVYAAAAGTTTFTSDHLRKTITPTRTSTFPVKVLFCAQISGLTFTAAPAVRLQLINTSSAQLGYGSVLTPVATFIPTATPVPPALAAAIVATVIVETDQVTPVTAATGGEVKIVQPNAATTVASSDAKISLAAPSGAVTKTVQIEVKPIDVADVPAPPSSSFIRDAFELNVYDDKGVANTTTSFTNTLTLTVKYTTDDLAFAGGDATKLVIMRYHSASKKWIAQNTQLDLVNKTVWASLRSLSTFALVAQPAPGREPTPTPTATPKPEPTATPMPPVVGDVAPSNGLVLGIIALGLALVATGGIYLARAPRRN